MIKILSLEKYNAITNLVLELEEENKILKIHNERLNGRLKELEQTLTDFENNGVKIKAELPFDEFEEVEFEEDISDWLKVSNDSTVSSVKLNYGYED
jgi:regulator of replication initiation timing